MEVDHRRRIFVIIKNIEATPPPRREIADL